MIFSRLCKKAADAEQASIDTTELVTDKSSECDKSGHWPEIARQWKQVGHPLRPSPEDICFYNAAVDQWVQKNGAPRVLLLGVTPELYRLPWPNGTDFLAVDRTQGMIDTVWPGPRDSVLCSDWTAIKLPEGSRDIVLCDGGLHLLAYPKEQGRLVRILHRVLSNHGLCIFRLFVPPAQRESRDSVLKDFLQGKIPNLNILKLRLGMALHQDPTKGVQLKTVWDAIHEAAPDTDLLARRIGWSVEHMRSINTYQNCADRYFFSDIADVRDQFCNSPGGFDFDSIRVPLYELGDRCPTVVLRRRPVVHKGK